MVRDAWMCQACARKGFVARARDVDHIVPKTAGGSDDISNLEALCIACHAAKTAAEDKGGARSVELLPRRMPRPHKPLLVICGPPGAGKSTHVKKHAETGDLILDLDDMAAEKYGKPLHDLGKAKRMELVGDRNDAVIRFAEGNTRHRRCWVITTAGRQADRAWWESKGATVVVINPGKDICRARIIAELRRPPKVKAALIGVIDRWT